MITLAAGLFHNKHADNEIVVQITAANSSKPINSREFSFFYMLEGFSILNIKGCPVREVKSGHH